MMLMMMNKGYMRKLELFRENDTHIILRDLKKKKNKRITQSRPENQTEF